MTTAASKAKRQRVAPDQITVIQSDGRWRFRLRVQGFGAVPSEASYANPEDAFKAAVVLRNRLTEPQGN
jgi:hypothetical protein